MFKNLKYKNPNKYLIKKDLFIRNFKIISKNWILEPTFKFF